jgi:hypothetical protein
MIFSSFCFFSLLQQIDLLQTSKRLDEIVVDVVAEEESEVCTENCINFALH